MGHPPNTNKGEHKANQGRFQSQEMCSLILGSKIANSGELI
jgi:hypothetical protein